MVMEKDLEILIRMRKVYQSQVRKLKEDWDNGLSRFANMRQYSIQLNIWEKRIKAYDRKIELIKGS